MNTSYPTTNYEYLDAEMRVQLIDLMDGESEMIIDLIETLTESTPELMEALESSLKDQNADGIREAAHALKSSHAQLGARQFADLCQQMEELGKSGSLQTAEALYRQILKEHEQVKVALESWKNALS